MATFDKIFKITDRDVIAKIDGSSIDSTAFDEDAVTAFREGLRKDKIDLDGRIFEAGTFALVSNTGSVTTGQTVPDAITRLEYLSEVMLDPIALRPVFEQSYADGQYHAYIVPNAPNIEGMEVKDEDIKRTVQVVKASGNESLLSDIRASSFVFLKDENGEVIKYPENASDDDFKGKPIAFIRDLNAFPKDPKVAEMLRKTNNAEETIATMGLDLKTLSPAPEDCVEAAKQQYAFTARLAENLKANGIEPNVPVPSAPTKQHDARATQIGAVAEEIKRA